MSEPVPQVMISDEQLEKLAVEIARYLPTYLLYRDPPVVPVGSVTPPEGAIQQTPQVVAEVTTTEEQPTIPTMGG